MKKFLTDNWIILVIGCAFLSSAFVALHNNSVIERNRVTLQQADMVEQTTQAILTRIMHGLDLGVRGYGLTRDDQMLRPYNEAIQTTPRIFKQLDSLLTLQNYTARSEAQDVMNQINQYIDLSEKMVDFAKNEDMTSFTELLKQDRGFEVWNRYSNFVTPLLAYENQLRQQSMSEYHAAIRNNLILQVTILLLGLPMLYLFVSRVSKERSQRYKVLKEVDHADRTYVFNDGSAEEQISENINKRTVAHVKHASDFVAALETGNYQVQWNDLDDNNRELNRKTLAGNLLRLRDRLSLLKTEDDQRNWVNEGLAKFSELVRTHQANPQQLSDQSIGFLTKYMKAQQGSLFVIDGSEEDRYLRLAGCYAFDKRKFLDKRIEIGDGQLGQTFLEGTPCLIKKVPQGYTHITSGLGEATATCVAIVPFKNDSQVIAVAEFATFNEFFPYQIEFLKKAGEFFAAAIVNVRTTEQMKQLLASAAEREVMLREREEELRQNMEELQATQEQMTRNQREENWSRKAS